MGRRHGAGTVSPGMGAGHSAGVPARRRPVLMGLEDQLSRLAGTLPHRLRREHGARARAMVVPSRPAAGGRGTSGRARRFPAQRGRVARPLVRHPQPPSDGLAAPRRQPADAAARLHHHLGHQREAAVRTDLDTVVIGAGVSGLHTARRLRDAGREVQVFEAADRVGGRMRTLRQDGWIIDEGAEAIATHGFTTTWSLIDRLGLTAADVPRIPGTIATWRDGQPHGNVGRARGMLTGLGLSPRARLQLLRFTGDGVRGRRSFDPDRPEATPLGEATVAGLADRYGSELLEWLLQPLVTGFTGWYPHRSAAGPFIAHMLATRSTANWRTYRDGMDTLARRLAAGLAVTNGISIREVTRLGEGARITLADGEQLTARSVVLAVPAPIA